MARLLRAPLRLGRLVTPPTPALCYRSFSTAVGQQVNTVNQQSSTPSRRQTRYEAPGKGRRRKEPVNFLPDSIIIKTSEVDTRVSYINLRDACKCPLCVDVHSKQRNFRTSDIPRNIIARSATWDGRILEVTWEKDIPGFDASHVSRYTKRQLRIPMTVPIQSSVGTLRPRTHWDKKRMEALQHWISFEDYMNDDAKFARAMRFLATMGLIFVKDIPDSREMVEKIATRIGPLRNTFYGPTWDVRQVPEAKNVAYTNQFLGFHMDLMYMKDPPGFQLLHCLRNSCEGGESLFADAFTAANYMFRFEREKYYRLTKTSLNYEYLHDENSYSRKWPVFEKKPKGWSGYPIVHVNYSPPFQGPRPINVTNERLQMEITALRSFTRRLEDEQNIFELKLNPGECVIFENRRIVHARRQFNTSAGERWLAGAYLDDDVVLSRFRVLRRTQRDAWINFLPKRLGEFLRETEHADLRDDES